MLFTNAVENGEIVNKEGYHQPNKGGRLSPNCGCRLTTEKGAYRDVTVRLPDGRLKHFYHQSDIVTENEDGNLVLDSHGYRTSTTKQRINRYIPNGFRLYQEDFDWYVELPNGSVVEFKDGMIVDPSKKEVLA